jgi:hypothetical protein
MKEQILKIIKEVKGELFDNPEYGEYPESELRLMNQVRALNAIEQKLSDFSPWVSVEDRLPELDKKVLLLYYKGKKGPFATEGQLIDKAVKLAKESHPVDFWRSVGRGLCYIDYAERDLQNLTSKKSKNRVVAYMPLPEPPKQSND